MERHIFECPDYANSGICNNKQCRLPHVDRAGQIRKNSFPVTGQGSSDQANNMIEEDDISSEGEEVDSDDVDSDDLAEELMEPNDPDDFSISHQKDFVQF